jgi:hypothetical protein
MLYEYDDVCDIGTVYDISCIFCLFSGRQPKQVVVKKIKLLYSSVNR